MKRKGMNCIKLIWNSHAASHTSHSILKSQQCWKAWHLCWSLIHVSLPAAPSIACYQKELLQYQKRVHFIAWSKHGPIHTCLPCFIAFLRSTHYLQPKILGMDYCPFWYANSCSKSKNITCLDISINEIHLDGQTLTPAVHMSWFTAYFNKLFSLTEITCANFQQAILSWACSAPIHL